MWNLSKTIFLYALIFSIMNEFLLLLSGLIIGGLIMVLWYFKYKQKHSIQSSVLLEKVKRVCQLITVQGEFIETYEHQEAQKMFFNLLHTEKKALLIVKGKAHVGLDLKHLDIEVDERNKTLKIKHLPEAQVLSLDTDIRYYDLKHSVWNKFNNEDLSQIQQNATNHLMKKVEASNLHEQASLQAIESLSLLGSLVEKLGWKVTFPNILEEKLRKKLP